MNEVILKNKIIIYHLIFEIINAGTDKRAANTYNVMVLICSTDSYMITLVSFV